MKILKIRFKNINSFYGDHPAIDFTANPLVSTGLFMISGPTGAGKSTLLDVISLALFNQIPRFSAKSLNSKQIAANGSVINLIAAEEANADAYAEVEYEVKNVGYRSRWSISKNRNGNWREYDMEVSRLATDEIISNKKSDVPVINEGLIGLKYGQFIQSIVLSQGNFAEFLRAKEKERSKLLEDITGSHIYRKLGAAAFQKNKTAQEKIKLAEQSLEAITLLADEERQEKQEILRESETKAKEINEKLSSFREQLNFKTQLEEAKKGITDTNAKLAHWQNSFEAFAPSLKKLEMHHSVADLTKPLNDLEHLQKNLLRDQKIIADYTAELKHISEGNAILIGQANQLFLTEFSVENLEEKILEQREKITGIERQTDAIISEGKATAEAIKKEISRSKDNFIKQLDSKNYQHIINELATYEASLSLDKTLVADDDANELTKLNVRFDVISNWLHQLAEIKQITDEGTEEKKQREDVRKLITETAERIQMKQQEVESAQQQLKKLEDQRQTERKKVDLEKLRSELTDGDPCPLCGATSHPYRQHVLVSLGEIETELLQQEANLKQQENSFNELIAKHKSLQTKELTHTERLEKLRDKYNRAKLKCNEFAADLRMEPEANETLLQANKQEIEEKRTAINEYNKLKETLISIRQLKDWSEVNIKRFEKLNELNKQKKNYYTGVNASQDCENLLATFRKNQTTTERISSQLQQLKNVVELTEVSLQEKRKKLQDSLETKNIESIEVAQQHLLSSESVAEINQTKERLQNEKITLETQLQNYKDKQETCVENLTLNESVADLKLRVELLEKTYSELLTETGTVKNMLAADTQNRTKQAEKIKHIETLRQNARKWNLLNTYIGDATGDRYSNFAQSLTLNNLIGLANQRLRHLSDRYVLSKLDQDFDSLRVIDLYQGNAERSVDTLSGGETFTLSLAMALALSDMASQNVKLDSLFIDEGFGTLDGETLEAAIATLERLQHDSQKTIGIISHRQELMSRVATQLIVSKGNDGKSSVAVMGF